ncbi:hypothetical protein DPMN_002968 [Dreissena polymorpha]|uniref:Uncharacterized protein n=1 Tax=Dreissena polymorpha TaxID=45954 RepID=A0A9D4MK30_DREPO|nr:hypothetical protein DPMN_002968 [Dreissena polymorpha]
MVSRVKYSKRIKTAPTHASVVCVNTGIGGLRGGTTRRSTGKKVILSKALWHATGTTRHKRNRGRPLHPSLSQAVSTLFVDELRKSSSLKSKSSHKSFCHHQPRPIDQNNKCCGDGRTTNRQMRAHWKPRSRSLEQQWTDVFKNALLAYRYEERARKGVLIIARSNLPKTAYRGWKGALHQQSEQKENK